jgi:hypothetical protein
LKRRYGFAPAPLVPAGPGSLGEDPSVMEPVPLVAAEPVSPGEEPESMLDGPVPEEAAERGPVASLEVELPGVAALVSAEPVPALVAPESDGTLPACEGAPEVPCAPSASDDGFVTEPVSLLSFARPGVAAVSRPAIPTPARVPRCFMPFLRRWRRQGPPAWSGRASAFT